MSLSKQNSATEATRKYYDKNADRWTNKKTDSFYHETQFAKFVAKLPKGTKVLDIGCAGGIHVPLFLGIGRHLSYEGIDISKSFLKTASRRYPQLSFKKMNIAEQNILPKNKFGGFLAIAVLMHVPRENWDMLFTNIETSMKSGAIGYISLPTLHPSGPEQVGDPRHFTLLNASDQRNYLKERGWKILHSGVLDGYTVQKNWQWYIVQLP